MKEKVKSIFCGLGYMALLLGINLAVSLVFQFIISFAMGFQMAAAGITMVGEEFLEKYTDFVMQYQLHATIEYQIFALFIIWLISKCRRHKLSTDANLTKFRPTSAPFIVILGIALSFLISIVMSAVVPEAMLEDYMEASAGIANAPMLVQFISAVILAPIVEEIFFRGYVLPRFRKAMPLPLAIFFSSLAFGLIHGQIVWITYATILGIIMTLIALRENSVWASILMHVAFNSVSLFSEYLPESDIFYLVIFVISLVACIGCFWLLFKNKKANTVVA